MSTTETTSGPSLRAVTGKILGTALGPFLGLLGVIAIFWIADTLYGSGHFATKRTAVLVLTQSATVAMAALGMTIIIISGGIDLSAGTAMALAGTVLAWCIREEYGVAAALAAAIGVGCLTGFINGALVSLLRVVPFIITLGTMTIYLGLAKILGDNMVVRPLPDQVPAWLSDLLAPTPGAWLPLVPGVWLLLALAIAVAAMLRYTVFGRHVLAIGSSEPTARLCGINVPMVRVAVYTLAGFFIGMAGVYQFSRLSVGDPTSGLGRELLVIAAVVIGGGSLSGGRGSVVGTLTGAVVMQVIHNGCTALDLPNPIQEIIIGAIIVAAVTLDQFRQRHSSA